MEFFETISAIATPLGSGGISIVKISGKDALKIVEKMIDKPVSALENRKLVLCKVKTKDFFDNALVVYYKAPNTYTGEDIVEIQCHGGVYLAQGILNETLSNGAKLAGNGEFTKRAFLNGKISLEGAEGVIDMINAETQSAVKAGYDLLNGELKKRIKVLQDNLTNVFAEIEVSLDYPEETIEFSSRKQITNWIQENISIIDELLKTYVNGRLVKNGVKCAIIGAPNVGKSSTMNCLLGYERAIVTSIAGTTRDTLEESFVYNNIKFNLIDTAGIRESEDIIEQIGIERAKENLKSADVVLFLFDASMPIENDYVNLLNSIENQKVIVCINKIDIENDIENKFKFITDKYKTIFISAMKNKGIDNLKQTLYDMVISGDISNTFMITSSRHKEILDNARNCLSLSLEAINNNVDLELVNLDIVSAWNYLGEITGQTSTEERINTIFSKFCLGK